MIPPLKEPSPIVTKPSYFSDGGFGEALQILKNGGRVAREGWNGKGMWIYLVPANSYPAQTQTAKDYWGEKQGVKPLGPNEAGSIPMVPYGAYLAMKTAQENVVPWLASQTDILAEDWQEVANA